jgi:acetyl-CoA C-acetyltransferase
MVHPTTPVLIGSGQLTWRGGFETCPTPIGLCGAAARVACADAGLGEEVLAGLDTVGVVSFTIDTPGSTANLPVPRAANPPEALAVELGAHHARHIYSHTGGNTPQAMVNDACAAIASGDSRFVLLAGGEFLGSLMKMVKAGRFDLLAAHDVPSNTTPERCGTDRPGSSAHEEAHGLGFPVNVYPLFENALRAHLGRSLEEHSAAMGALFAPFTKVAVANPQAWFRTPRTPEELVTVSAENRMVGFPYPKRLNAIIQVDQAAALLLTSFAHAQALGVDPARMVFLHGCADTVEKWDILDRVNYHSSPAMAVCGREALAMAGCGIGDIATFDLYSCFPVAVELACRELGLAEDDPRGLTLTGGLPYFGGPGNNYAMHAIAEAMAFARANPGQRVMTTANGWYLTKHAMGIYATTPFEDRWQRPAPASYQGQIDRLVCPPMTETPDGPATIESYTSVHGRDGPRMGIIIGRDQTGRRFVANTPKGDAAMLADLESREGVGRTGAVSSENGRTVFVLD